MRPYYLNLKSVPELQVRPGGAQGPGLCLTIPCTDTSHLVDLRTGVHEVPSQQVITRDSVALGVAAMVLYRVTEPSLAVCGDENYKLSTKYEILF